MPAARGHGEQGAHPRHPEPQHGVELPDGEGGGEAAGDDEVGGPGAQEADQGLAEVASRGQQPVKCQAVPMYFNANYSPRFKRYLDSVVNGANIDHSVINLPSCVLRVTQLTKKDSHLRLNGAL